MIFKLSIILLISFSQPLNLNGQNESYTPDSISNQISEIKIYKTIYDRQGKITEKKKLHEYAKYNKMGFRVSIQSNNHKYSNDIEYDSLGRMSSYFNWNLDSKEFMFYDSLGRKRCDITESWIRYYKYNNLDSLIMTIDINKDSTINITQYEYDNNNRIREIYSGNKNNPLSHTLFLYDKNGYLIEICTSDSSGVLNKSNYQYNSDGNKTDYINIDNIYMNETVHEKYNSRGIVIEKTHLGHDSSFFEMKKFNEAGKIVYEFYRRKNDSALTNYKYDKYDNLIEICHNDKIHYSVFYENSYNSSGQLCEVVCKNSDIPNHKKSFYYNEYGKIIQEELSRLSTEENDYFILKTIITTYNEQGYFAERKMIYPGRTEILKFEYTKYDKNK